MCCNMWSMLYYVLFGVTWQPEYVMLYLDPVIFGPCYITFYSEYLITFVFGWIFGPRCNIWTIWFMLYLNCLTLCCIMPTFVRTQNLLHIMCCTIWCFWTTCFSPHIVFHLCIILWILLLSSVTFILHILHCITMYLSYSLCYAVQSFLLLGMELIDPMINATH